MLSAYNVPRQHSAVQRNSQHNYTTAYNWKVDRHQWCVKSAMVDRIGGN